MATTKDTKAPTKKRAVFTILKKLRSFVAIVGKLVLLLIVSIVALELFVPSLDFHNGAGDYAFQSVSQPSQTTVTSSAGHGWPARHYDIVTSNGRNLSVDVIAPQGALGTIKLPLTIVMAGFLPPEWILDRTGMHGQNALIIYRSPRLNTIMSSAWPSSVFDIVSTNPITHGYNVYRALHEAPLDVAEIAHWATKDLGVEPERINLVGLGSGSLIAAAAADRMQSMGIPVRALTMIYPPADIASAIRDNASGIPHNLRNPISHFLAFLYRRLELEQHLPAVTTSAKQLIIPINAFELATYAALPAVTLAGENSEFTRIDVNYSGFYLDQNVTRIRDTVLKWLTAQGAIN